jgi:hypothetical protein
MSRWTWASLLAIASAAGLSAALFTSAQGCASTCGANCPTATVYIGSNDNVELENILTDIEVNGPACPPEYSVGCAGDRDTTICTHTTITGQSAGTCDVLFVFSDRDAEIVHLKFGQTENSNGSCCTGYPVIGPSVYTIPDKPTGRAIYVADASTDAVTVIPDASPDDAANGADAGTDAAKIATDGDARDGGAESLAADAK